MPGLNIKGIRDEYFQEDRTWLRILLDKVEEFFWPVIYKFIQIKRSFEYAKVGWDTADFDSAYALEEFTNKLEKLANTIEKNKIHCNYEEDVKNIKETVRLFRRVMDDNYFSECEEPIDKKYGEMIRSWEREYSSGNSRLNFRRPGETDENREEIRELELEAVFKSEEMLKEDWKKALKIMEEHFFGWRD